MAQRITNRKFAALLIAVGCLALWWTRSTSSTSFSSSSFRTAREGGLRQRYGSNSKSSSSSSSPRIAMITMNNKESSYDILSMANKAEYCKKNGYDFRIDFEGKGFWHKFNMIEDAISTDLYDWVWWLDFDTLITNTTVTIEEIINEAFAESDRDPEEIDMIFTPDCWPLNAGSMLFRTRPTIPTLLSLARHCNDKDNSLSEQDCIRDIIGINRDAPDHPSKSAYWSTRFLMIPQKRMNAFPEEIKCFEDEKMKKKKKVSSSKNKSGGGGGAKKGKSVGVGVGKEGEGDGEEMVTVKGGKWEPGDFIIHFAGAWAHVKEDDPTGFLMQKYRHYVDSV